MVRIHVGQPLNFTCIINLFVQVLRLTIAHYLGCLKDDY